MRRYTAAGNYFDNLVGLLADSRQLRPLAVTYYVTPACNLHCVYCEDFAQAQEPLPAPLPLDEACQVLQTIRTGTDHLTLTGGEPLLYPEIVSLVQHARQLRFHITLQTNGLLLHQFEAALPAVARLVVSLDSTDPATLGRITGVSRAAAETILENVRTLARRQHEWGGQMVVNAVLTPESLSGVRQLLSFCRENNLLLSLSPQSFNNWPRYELLVSDEYQSLLGQLIALKRHGAPLLGSLDYLRTLVTMAPFSCYPLLVPRILPNGDLVYPCRPVERSGSCQGGRPANLLAAASWEEALDQALEAYGPPPRVCNSCFQQCYVEPSLMQARPLALLRELLLYRASRRGGLATYGPG